MVCFAVVRVKVYVPDSADLSNEGVEALSSALDKYTDAIEGIASQFGFTAECSS